MANNTKTKSTENNSVKDEIVTYFKGVKSEWGKVTWPERRQVIVECGVVLFVVIMFTVVVFVLDKIFIGLLNLLK